MSDALRDVVAQFHERANVIEAPREVAAKKKGKGFELTALVLNKRFPTPTLQHVMAAFADHAGDDETAYPSVAALAAKTGYARRTVQQSLATLTALGLLREVSKRKCTSGAVKVRRIERAALEALPDPPRGAGRKG